MGSEMCIRDRYIYYVSRPRGTGGERPQCGSIGGPNSSCWNERKCTIDCLKANVMVICADIRSAVAINSCSVRCYGSSVAKVLVAVGHGVPDGRDCCLLWFIKSDSSVFFLFIQTRLGFLYTPWQYCRICGLDLLIVIHPPYLQVCAEPRRA